MSEDFVAAWNANAALLHETYQPEMEHDACGVGLVAALDGKRRRDVVEAGIDALKAVWHRGRYWEWDRNSYSHSDRARIPRGVAAAFAASVAHNT